MSAPSIHLDADLIILGGGCAGLSLASRLAASRSKLCVLVLEGRDHYEEDRTWCGWRTAPHPYQACATAAWPQWRIVTTHETIERSSKRYPYEMIPADRFYAESCRVIENSKTVALVMAATVSTVVERVGSVSIELLDGRTFSSKWLVDTRPRVTALSPPSLWQNFVGYVVHESKALATKIGDSPVLMDFQSSGTSAVQFTYVLPLGAGAYLCEWTRFSKERGEEIKIEQQLREWIGENAGQNWYLGRRESGSLPMSLVTRQLDTTRTVVLAGTAGGSMRASTGYAFHSIQRWADACCNALLAGEAPVPPLRNRVLDFMDDVFLRALQQQSSSGEDIFCGLFKHTEPDALVRFLSGQPRLADYWPVMRSLPWIDFSLAAFQSLSGAGVP
jgi:lycopene beta-cyclase